MNTQTSTTWLALSSVAAWALGVGAGALSFDVKLDFDDDMAERIDIFLVAATAIVLGLMTIGVSKLRKRHVQLAWIVSAVLGLLCAIMLFYSYLDRRAEWSCVFAAQSRIVVGATLAPAAAAHAASTGLAKAPCSLIEDFGGQLDMVWPRDERVGRHKLLAWYSYGASLSLAIAVFSIAQAVGHRSGPRSGTRRIPEAQ